MTAQITELLKMPIHSAMEPVRNAPLHKSGDVIEWLKSGKYRGNKPTGGLWTSTHTPDDPDYLSDWQRGRHINELIKMAVPRDPGITAYFIQPCEAARVLRIECLDDAHEFTERYHLAKIPIPDKLRQGLGLTISDEITDWQRAMRNYDGITLTARAADEIMYEVVEEGITTAFHTWHCESTLWGRWVFESVKECA